ncbi:hypothetical protein BASA81_012642 [Batrachochytrium salamandrivorans]|nr:hypothetical protein BASA81_012642 [Batrachochytrium salamandrivorans]
MVEEPGLWFVRRCAVNGLVIHVDNGARQWRLVNRRSARELECVEMSNREGEQPAAASVMLKGPLDAAEMFLLGLDSHTVSRFSHGIPVEWEEMIDSPPPPPAPPPERRKSSRVALKPALNLDEDALLLRALRQSEGTVTSRLSAGIQPRTTTVPAAPVWTKEEKLALHRALIQIDCSTMTGGGFWELCSQEFVSSKTPHECEQRWMEETCKPTNSSKHAVARLGEKHSEADAMRRMEKIAKLGQAKFRQQARRDWEAGNLRKSTNTTSSILSTPFRAQLARITTTQAELCCDGISTPVNTFVFGEDTTTTTPVLARLFREEEDRESPDVLVRVNRDHLDGYVMALMKQSTRAGGRKAKRVKKTVAAVVETPCRPSSSSSFLGMAIAAADDGVEASLTPRGTIHLITKHPNTPPSLNHQDDEEDDDL